MNKHKLEYLLDRLEDIENELNFFDDYTIYNPEKQANEVKDKVHKLKHFVQLEINKQ